MPKLTVNDVNYSYKDKKVLHDINFQVNNGLVGILGHNGAGKTTLIKLLNTLFNVQEGKITLDDLDYKTNISNIRKGIGYLPQNFYTYNTLTGREFLNVIGDIKCHYSKTEMRNHLDSIITELNMEDYINRKIKTYSGGMKQKLGIAQVLVGNPKLIIIDEPTVGLDPDQRNVIRELLPRISKDRIVIVTTHIVEDIEFYCNYLILMKEGRIIYKGKKSDFMDTVKGKLWETLAKEEEFEFISSKAKVIASNLEGDNFKIRYVSENKLTENSEIIEPSLQEAYLAYQYLF